MNVMTLHYNHTILAVPVSTSLGFIIHPYRHQGLLALPEKPARPCNQLGKLVTLRRVRSGPTHLPWNHLNTTV